MKELAVSNFIILIIDKQICNASKIYSGLYGGGAYWRGWRLPSLFRFLAPGAMFGSGGQRLGTKHFQLTQFEEVFTSHHWMVRKYKLKRQKNRVRGRGKKLKLFNYAVFFAYISLREKENMNLMCCTYPEFKDSQQGCLRIMSLTNSEKHRRRVQ
ncbi:hypothetical protein F2Q68_00042619 [Brassica cretica]|uniref:Uncharacterized protein n=1 Tax=Brassica cretica TaxID=69181 RepID=A0A8S9MD58_BRACR|nr:hypothetical protein F2Q68_00042619 [Brassica cretica]